MYFHWKCFLIFVNSVYRQKHVLPQTPSEGLCHLHRVWQKWWQTGSVTLYWTHTHIHTHTHTHTHTLSLSHPAFTSTVHQASRRVRWSGWCFISGGTWFGVAIYRTWTVLWRHSSLRAGSRGLEVCSSKSSRMFSYNYAVDRGKKIMTTSAAPAPGITHEAFQQLYFRFHFVQMKLQYTASVLLLQCNYIG